MFTRFLALLIGSLPMIGCTTVHTSSGNGLPLGIWFTGFNPDPGAPLFEPLRPHDLENVLLVLRENGLHPIDDGGGISVPDAEEASAREVLLTDRRLTDSNLIVLLAIPAGTGRKTIGGFEVPDIAPLEGRTRQ